METMSLRRTKEKTLVDLPSKTLETVYVELSGEEREIYDHMELRAKAIVTEFIYAEGSLKSYLTVLSALVRLRQICTDVAMCPPNLGDILPVTKIGGKRCVYLSCFLQILFLTPRRTTLTDHMLSYSLLCSTMILMY